MTQLIENWPEAAALLVTLALIVRAYVNLVDSRLGRKQSQIDAIDRLNRINSSDLSPERALLLGATLEHAYSQRFPVGLYYVLRQAVDPAEAVARFKFVERFVELSEFATGIRFRKCWLLFSCKTNRISMWRVIFGYSALFLVLALPAIALLLSGAAAIAVNDWTRAGSFLPLGIVLAGAAMRFFSVGNNFQRHFGAFETAAANLFIQEGR